MENLLVFYHQDFGYYSEVKTLLWIYSWNLKELEMVKMKCYIEKKKGYSCFYVLHTWVKMHESQDNGTVLHCLNGHLVAYVTLLSTIFCKSGVRNNLWSLCHKCKSLRGDMTLWLIRSISSNTILIEDKHSGTKDGSIKSWCV